MPSAESLLQAAGAVHVAGVDLDWERFERPWSPPRVPVPTVGWQRRTLWIDSLPAAGAMTQRVDVPDVGTVFELAFGPQSDWLKDHKIGGATLVPAAWLLEWLASIGRNWTGSDIASVCDLLIERAIVWSADARVQALVKPNGEVTVHRAAGKGRWQRCASARLQAHPTDQEATWQRPQQGADSQEITAEAAYELLAARRLNYGPVFRRAGMVRSGDWGGWARIDLEDAPADMNVHPAVLDAAMHPIAVAVAQRKSGVALPYAAAKYTSLRPLESQAEATGIVTERLADELVLDVWLCDERGPAAVLHGLRARSLRRSPAQLLQTKWSKQEQGEPSLPTVTASRVVVWSDEANDLPPALSEHRRLTTVPADETVDLVLVPLRCDGDPLVVDLGPIERCKLAAQTLLAPHGEGDALTNAAIVVVTHHAQRVSEDDVLHASGAAVWSYVRALRREITGGSWRLLDIDDGTTSAQLHAALATSREELAVRNGALWAPKPVPYPNVETAGGGHFVIEHAGSGRLRDVTVRRARRLHPGPGEVRVQVRAAGMNFRDVLIALGAVPGAGKALGGEVAGHITELGPGVVGLTVGQRVMGFGLGCFASEVIVDARELAALPPELAFEDAATLPIAFATAWYGLVERARLSKDERVLIHAAAGGVGMAAVQIARQLGAEVFATAHPRKWSRLREMGIAADHIASSRDAAFGEAFEQVAGTRRFDVVLDALTGELVDAGLRLLREGGRFIEIGKRDIRDPAEVKASCGVYYEAFDLASMSRADRGDLMKQIVAQLSAGQLQPLPRHTFGLGQIRSAMRFMAEARHVGKIVLTGPPLGGGCALITGGLGALGQHTAQWLLQRHGVDKVVLVSRSADEAKLGAELRQLRGAGRDVVSISADVADRDAMAEVVAACGSNLRWVVHAAGVLDDGAALSQSPATVRRVLRPKIDGARVLDELTRGRRLDAFVVYGSAASLFGPPGQSAYAAANAAMEAVVHARRARGEVATYVAWGPWSGAGMASSETARRSLAKLGVGLLEPAHALASLDDVLFNRMASVAVLIDSRAEAKKRDKTRDALAADRPWIDVVRNAVANVLSLDYDDVPLDQNLRDMGFDSLGAMELVSELVEASGRKISLEHLDADEVTVRVLAEHTQS